ncbi:MAG: transposase, partial [Candidatus Syntrophosphaera sp.]|nr:transposase [Candidatus Syntrophosphaera sp.]
KYKLREWLEESYEVFSIYLNFPPEHWMKIKCTNVLERLNDELRRRERCIRIFSVVFWSPVSLVQQVSTYHR